MNANQDCTMDEGGRRSPRIMVALAGLMLVASLVVSSSVEGAPRKKTTTTRYAVGPTSATGTDGACETAADCADDNACTVDACENNECSNTLQPGCVPCDTETVCPPLDVVFVMDTSGSMVDEAAVLCSVINQVVDDLAAEGISVLPAFLGITETPGGPFECLVNHVTGIFGPDVPGVGDSCVFPGGTAPSESWGPATAIVAERFPWKENSVRVIVPMSDEGPCNGSLPDGCNDPGDDRDTITNAIAVAQSNNVRVSPITGTSSNACVLTLASYVAAQTGGIWFETEDPVLDLADAIIELVRGMCETVPLPCDDLDPCTEEDTCVDGVCQGNPIPDCVRCELNADCDDGNACTDDFCVNDTCQVEVNYDIETQCCDPGTGAVVAIDDKDVCTEDVCDPLTGTVLHRPAGTDTPCDDRDVCTVADVCDGQGACHGTDITTIGCTTDEDCFGRSCDTETGFCTCDDKPTLCVEVTTQPSTSEGCYAVDELVDVDVVLGETPHLIVGGQFLLKYDPTVLEFVSITAGKDSDPASPFELVINSSVNESEGSVFYAIGVAIGHPGTHGPAVLATVRFRAIAGCAASSLCFDDQNPANTRLTNNFGSLVEHIPCCTEVAVRGDALTLSCPESVMVNADAGTLSAEATWDPIEISGGCSALKDLTCTSENVYDAPVDHLITDGGVFPAGTTHFTCTVSDSSGCMESTSCGWDVTVDLSHGVEADVQLAPTVVAGPLQRCIVFEFFGPDCNGGPVVHEQTVNFGLPNFLAGQALNVTFEIPAGQYTCVTARDPLHTLRAIGDIRIDGPKYVVDFVGPDRWLVGGDLDDSATIDTMDYLLFLDQFGASLDPNTPCGSTPGPHADINGDGVVDLLDEAFILGQFTEQEVPNCCSSRAAALSGDAEGVSVKRLRAMGLGHLGAADLNGDGVLDPVDIYNFLRLDRQRDAKVGHSSLRR